MEGGKEIIHIPHESGLNAMMFVVSNRLKTPPFHHERMLKDVLSVKAMK